DAPVVGEASLFEHPPTARVDVVDAAGLCGGPAVCPRPSVIGPVSRNAHVRSPCGVRTGHRGRVALPPPGRVACQASDVLRASICPPPRLRKLGSMAAKPESAKTLFL